MDNSSVFVESDVYPIENIFQGIQHLMEDFKAIAFSTEDQVRSKLVVMNDRDPTAVKGDK